MSENICENCKNYIQHYRKAKKNYYFINCGHCIKKVRKACYPSRKACENFTQHTTILAK